MYREAFRLWNLLRKASILCIVFLVVSLATEVHTFLSASTARDVRLTWSVPPEDDVAGYNVYYGPISRYDQRFDGYPNAERVEPGEYTVEGREVRYLLANLDANLTYWVSVTAFDHEGNESQYSNEKAVVPGGESGGNESVTMEASSGGCQTVSIAGDDRPRDRTVPLAWPLLLLVVPGWIGVLRRRFRAPSP